MFAASLLVSLPVLVLLLVVASGLLCVPLSLFVVSFLGPFVVCVAAPSLASSWGFSLLVFLLVLYPRERRRVSSAQIVKFYKSDPLYE